MNLEAEILKEHSKNQTIRIASFIGNDKKRFKEFIQLFMRGNYRLTQRSAWILIYCVMNHPELITPYHTLLIKKIGEPGIHDSVKRNILKVWTVIPLPEKYFGEVYSMCYQYLRSIDEPVAVKVHAMTVMERIVKIYPGLKNELQILIEDMMPFGKPAIISRGRKILNRLSR